MFELHVYANLVPDPAWLFEPKYVATVAFCSSPGLDANSDRAKRTESMCRQRVQKSAVLACLERKGVECMCDT